MEADSAPPTEAIGSALYMAPEVEAATPYGLPADVFSFGAIQRAAAVFTALFGPLVAAHSLRSGACPIVDLTGGPALTEHR